MIRVSQAPPGPDEISMTFDLSIRPALERDCRDIARLFLIGSEGLAELIWTRERGAGESVIDVGARRCARRNVSFSYESCVLAEAEGRTVGLLHAYRMEATPRSADEKVEPVLRPFAALRHVGGLYLSALVVEPEYRGRGIATRLLGWARRRALDLALPRLSIVVLDQNEAAMRLYRRVGFTETDRAPLSPHPALPGWAGDALLLTKSIDRP